MTSSKELLQRAAAFQWGDFAIAIDRELPAIILGIKLDETRGLECLVAPEQALDLALKIAGAVERIRVDRQRGGAK